nr:uncharacterized protein LOC132767244 [Anolis sagrei ordinatus]
MGPYNEKPQEMAAFVEGLMQSHDPTWGDCKQLLNALFTAEERRRILTDAMVIAQQGHGAVDPILHAQQQFPITKDPEWNPNNEIQYAQLKKFQNILVQAIKKGPPKVINLKKLYTVEQNKIESPSAFLERLIDAYRRWSPYDMDEESEKSAGKLALKQSFIAQVAPDIRRKIQKSPGFAELSLNRLMEIATQADVNREEQEERKDEEKQKRKAKIFLTAMAETRTGQRGRGRGRGYSKGKGRLGRFQCALCGETGHWKSACPYAKENGNQNDRENRGPWRGAARGRARGRGGPGRVRVETSASGGPACQYQPNTEEDMDAYYGMACMQDWD